MTGVASHRRPERILAFRRGDRVLGVEGRYSREVTPLASLTPVPLAPAALLGVGNLRGVPLPVIDLAPLLGLTAAPWSSSLPVHVATADGVTAGIAIDEVAGFDPWPAGEPVPLDSREPALLRSVSRGSVPFRGGDVIVLDLAAVLRLARDRLASGDRPVST
jgi:purine-binding chemotaxis protein CheW